MKTLKVYTVVVSYNAYKGGFFPRCLDHLAAIQLENDQYHLEHTVIVVDSHSGDQTPALVREAFPNMRVVASDENLGYAGGNNAGISEALKAEADYIAIVTQDVYVEPGWLLEAVDAIEKDRQIGVVQPLLLLWPDQDRINSTGNQIHYLGYGYAGDYRLPLSQFEKKTPQNIAYFSGAVCLFQAAALRKTGLFDERLWMYNEDQDLGWRFWLNGYRNVMVPDSRAYHQYEFSRSISKIYFMDRNRLIVLLQNYHWLTLVLLAPFLLANELGSAILSAKAGWWKEKRRVWAYFANPKHLAEILRVRKLRQGSRTVKESAIIKRFTGKILFQDLQTSFISKIVNPVLDLIWGICRKLIIW